MKTSSKIRKLTPDCICDLEKEMEHPYFHRRIRKEDHYDTTHLTTFVIGILVGALLTLTAI